MSSTIHCKHFESLTPNELYSLLRVRSEVFVVEQKCIFLDLDNVDQSCHHVWVENDTRIVSCSRLVPPGVSYKEMSIGRVVTHPDFRGTGAGKLLMKNSIDFLHKLFGEGPVRIGAQQYLWRFYESFGFQQSGEVYDEDGIDHIPMIKP